MTIKVSALINNMCEVERVGTVGSGMTDRQDRVSCAASGQWEVVKPDGVTENGR